MSPVDLLTRQHKVEEKSGKTSKHLNKTQGLSLLEPRRVLDLIL